MTTNKWLVVLASAMGNFALTLESGITGVSYPALAEAFHTDTSTVLWVSVAFWVTGEDDARPIQATGGFIKK